VPESKQVDELQSIADTPTNQSGGVDASMVAASSLPVPEDRSAGGIITDLDSVTHLVLDAMAGTPDARLREIMASFVQHMHAFAREVRLTEDEFEQGLPF
jgi:catechol 2,3-dioxygenase-like protein